MEAPPILGRASNASNATSNIVNNIGSNNDDDNNNIAGDAPRRWNAVQVERRPDVRA